MELVVITFDKYNPDGIIERRDDITAASHYVRGDVVDFGPDGTDWGRCVVNNPLFVVVRAPISAVVAKAMLTSEPGDRIANPVLQKRQFRINMDALALLGYTVPDAAVCRRARGVDDSYLNNNVGNADLDVRAVEFIAAREQKPPLKNPLVLGAADPMVLGG